MSETTIQQTPAADAPAGSEIAPGASQVAPAAGEAVAFSGPPPADVPAKTEESDAAEPRRRLLELAAELVQSRNRHLLVEYLRLRRVLR